MENAMIINHKTHPKLYTEEMIDYQCRKCKIKYGISLKYKKTISKEEVEDAIKKLKSRECKKCR